MSDANAEKKAQAERHFADGSAAYGRGDLTEAIVNLQAAVRLDPGNAEYQQMLNDVRSRASEVTEEARAPGERAKGLSPERRRFGLMLMAASLVGLAAVWTWRLWPEPPKENLADQYEEVADFAELYQTPNGGWYGVVDEEWGDYEVSARLTRCDTIASQLAGDSDAVVVVTTTDHVMLLCGGWDM